MYEENQVNKEDMEDRVVAEIQAREKEEEFWLEKITPLVSEVAVKSVGR